MKKLIILHQEYPEAKNKTNKEVLRQEIFNNSVKIFKEQMKELLDVKFFKILKELYDESAVLVEYEEVLDDRMWVAFRAADIVNIVDSAVPSDI